MRFLSLIVLIFLLSAFAIGVSFEQSSDITPKNLSDIIDATNLTSIEFDRVEPSDSVIDVNSIITILEAYVRFVITFVLEIMKVGINFGYENPDYFEPDFIMKIIKLIVVLIIVGLLIQPVSYAVVLLALLVIWIHSKFKKNNQTQGGKKK